LTLAIARQAGRRRRCHARRANRPSPGAFAAAFAAGDIDAVIALASLLIQADIERQALGGVGYGK